MEFLIPEIYTGAFGIICKALAQSGQQQIIGKKETFWVDFEILVNLPKPNEIIARCFVCLYIYISNFFSCKLIIFILK
jgi:hypothetical protein